MKKIISLIILSAFVSTGFFISFSTDAEAIPAFARKEGADCTLCHVGFPKLNSLGYGYKQRGYRMEDADGIRIWENSFQLAGMAALGYEFMDMEKTRTTGEEPTNSGMETNKTSIGELKFFAAGNLAPKISFFLDFEFEDDADTGLKRGNTFVIINDILPAAMLNFKVGEFKSELYWLSSARKLGMTGYLAAGGHSTFWETVEHEVEELETDEAEDQAEELEGVAQGIGFSGRGLEINGILPTHTRYHIGGGNDSTTNTDNSITKIFVILEQEVEFGGEEQRVGFLWVSNRIGQDDNNMPVSKDTERTHLYGSSVDLHVPIGLAQPLNVIFAYFYYDDKTTATTPIESDYDNYIVEAILPIGEKIILESFYERIDIDDEGDNDIDFYRVGVSAHYYFTPNVDLIFDYSHDDANVNLGSDGRFDLNQDMFMLMFHIGF